jgi:hypothetical protein
VPRATHEVAENAIGLGGRQSTASNATMSRTAPPKAELAELARNHVCYEVAMLRTVTSTTYGASADQVSRPRRRKRSYR